MSESTDAANVFSKRLDKKDGDDMVRYDVHRGDKNIAYAALRPTSTEGDGPWLAGLATAPDFRRQGLARQLMQAIEKDYPGQTIRLRPLPYKDSPLTSEQLKQFYASLGYADYDEDDPPRMSKTISKQIVEEEEEKKEQADKEAAAKSKAVKALQDELSQVEDTQSDSAIISIDVQMDGGEIAAIRLNVNDWCERETVDQLVDIAENYVSSDAVEVADEAGPADPGEGWVDITPKFAVKEAAAGQPMTAGQYMLASILPPDVYTPGMEINKKSAKKIFGDLARNHPDKYAEIVAKAVQFGRDTARSTGGASFTLEHLKTPAKVKLRREKLKQEIKRVLDTTPPKKRREAVIALLAEAQKGDADFTVREAEREGNPIVELLKGAGRGNPAAVNRLIGSDLMYADSRDRPIAVPIMNSFSDGLLPGELVAKSYGARKGLVEAKLSVASGGAMAKLLNSAAHRMVVTQNDPSGEVDTDPSNIRGLPVSTDDSDNVGALLATTVGPYKRNTVITPKILADIKRRGHDEILVRSPITTGDTSGGVYAEDAGVRDKGDLPGPGELVGVSAAAAVSEPITQSALCLDEDTMVRMGDGSEMPISDICPGMFVMGCDLNGNMSQTRVVNNHYKGIKETRTYFFENDCYDSGPHELSFICCTPDHRILWMVEHLDSDGVDLLPPSLRDHGEQQLRYSYQLTPIGKPPGDSRAVLLPEHDKSVVYAPYDHCHESGRRHCYDLEVEHPDHLFVLANGMVVHNSAKHKGGVATANSSSTRLSGFDLIDKLFNTPKHFRDGATHAELDGRIDKVTKARQGGVYVHIGDKEHYVPASQNLKYKLGDRVEAGDQLSDGVINPRKVIEHKGLGEGARQLTYALREAIRDSGTNANARNLQLVVAGLVNRVRMTDEFGDHAPDDIVPYNEIAQSWQPREGHQLADLQKSMGNYLEKPVLHYTIGTRITPSVAKKLKEYKIGQVYSHRQPPPFKAEMVRAADLLQTDSDWMTRHIGTNLQKSTLEAVHTGRVSDENSTSFVPSRARAVNFGKVGPFSNQKVDVKGLNLGHL